MSVGLSVHSGMGILDGWGEKPMGRVCSREWLSQRGMSIPEGEGDYVHSLEGPMSGSGYLDLHPAPPQRLNLLGVAYSPARHGTCQGSIHPQDMGLTGWYSPPPPYYWCHQNTYGWQACGMHSTRMLDRKQFFQMCPEGSLQMFPLTLVGDIDNRDLDIGLDVKVYRSPCCDQLNRLFSFKRFLLTFWGHRAW